MLPNCLTCGKTVNRIKNRFCSQKCWSAWPDRFWSHVNKTDSCWIWTARRDKSGYGLIRIDGRDYRAHRKSWELLRGPIPNGLSVCHNCPGGDNPSCVNPSHLFIGTQLDNSLDASKKGRLKRGEAVMWHKLTAKQIPEIREKFFSGVTQTALSKEYGINQSCISKLVRRLAWKHVA